MADRSAETYQRQENEAVIEETEDSESSSDTSSDSMDLHESELEISASLDFNKLCEEIFNPVIDFNDIIEQRDDLLYLNPQCSQNMESHEPHSAKNIEQSGAFLVHEYHCNTNIEPIAPSSSHEYYSNKNSEPIGASFSYETCCNDNIERSEASFSYEPYSYTNIEPNGTTFTKNVEQIGTSFSHEAYSNKIIEQSGVSFSHEPYGNKNIEQSGTSFSLEPYSSKNIEPIGESSSHESYCNLNMEWMGAASFDHEPYSNKNIGQRAASFSIGKNNVCDFECNATAEANQDLLDTKCNKFGCVFPFDVIQRRLNKHRTDDIKVVKIEAAVYMAAVIEYVAREVFDLAMSYAKISKSTRIKPRHLLTAIHFDEEMGMLFNGLKQEEAGDPS